MVITITILIYFNFKWGLTVTNEVCVQKAALLGFICCGGVDVVRGHVIRLLRLRLWLYHC